ncbi:hypothetical protein SUGI_1098730 [Cryptomeria japonica]|nr:hypothetical protein SUGI_1098730 [Cryptomeria japonica]
MISSPYKEHWNKLRRLLHNNVLSVALQSSSHYIRKRDLKEKNGVVRSFYALKMIAMSFIAPLCFGPDFEDDKLLSRLEEFVAEDMSLSKRGDVHLDSFPEVWNKLSLKNKWKKFFTRINNACPLSQGEPVLVP